MNNRLLLVYMFSPTPHPTPFEMSKTPKMQRESDKYEHRETIAEFLARGGTIQQCPPKHAIGTGAGHLIVVDGYALPQGTIAPDGVPGFVVSETTYDQARREQASIEDDGTAATWRSYERESVPGKWNPLPLMHVVRSHDDVRDETEG